MCKLGIMLKEEDWATCLILSRRAFHLDLHAAIENVPRSLKRQELIHPLLVLQGLCCESNEAWASSSKSGFQAPLSYWQQITTGAEQHTSTNPTYKIPLVMQSRSYVWSQRLVALKCFTMGPPPSTAEQTQVGNLDLPFIPCDIDHGNYRELAMWAGQADLGGGGPGGGLGAGGRV